MKLKMMKWSLGTDREVCVCVCAGPEVFLK